MKVIPKTAVVTGGAGQDASYLSELLLNEGYTVYGLVRQSARDTYTNLRYVIDCPDFNLVKGDINDVAMVEGLARLKPEHFYHLAALTHVGDSFKSPYGVFQTNTMGTVNILDALYRNSPNTRFYFAGSSEMYPEMYLHVPKHTDVSSLGANSPYGASKVAAFLQTRIYREAYGMFTVGGIAFNHESRRRGAQFVTRKIALGVKNFKETGERLQLGNVSAKRDWHHAIDTVMGMYSSLLHPDPSEYIFASGETHSVEEFARKVCDVYNVSYEDAIIPNCPQFMRQKDIDVLLGDPSKARSGLYLNYF